MSNKSQVVDNNAKLQEIYKIVSNRQNKTITPGTEDQTVEADAGGILGTVTATGDANFVEGNIKSGVSLWGKTGTHKGIADISNGAEASYVSFDDDIDEGYFVELTEKLKDGIGQDVYSILFSYAKDELMNNSRIIDMIKVDTDKYLFAVREIYDSNDSYEHRYVHFGLIYKSNGAWTIDENTSVYYEAGDGKFIYSGGCYWFISAYSANGRLKYGWADQLKSQTVGVQGIRISLVGTTFSVASPSMVSIHTASDMMLYDAAEKMTIVKLTDNVVAISFFTQSYVDEWSKSFAVGVTIGTSSISKKFSLSFDEWTDIQFAPIDSSYFLLGKQRTDGYSGLYYYKYSLSSSPSSAGRVKVHDGYGNAWDFNYQTFGYSETLGMCYNLEPTLLQLYTLSGLIATIQTEIKFDDIGYTFGSSKDVQLYDGVLIVGGNYNTAFFLESNGEYSMLGTVPHGCAFILDASTIVEDKSNLIPRSSDLIRVDISGEKVACIKQSTSRIDGVTISKATATQPGKVMVLSNS